MFSAFKEEGFSEEKINKAISHVVKNCRYPNPTIAQFINFDHNQGEDVTKYKSKIKFPIEPAGEEWKPQQRNV